MPDLIEKFFREDLTEAEEQALEESLWASEAEAERLVSLAERAYYRYGFPKPGWPGSPGSPPPAGSGLKPWLGLSFLVLGTTATFFLWHHQGTFFSNLLSSLKKNHADNSSHLGLAKGEKGRLSSLSRTILNEDRHSLTAASRASSEEKTNFASMPNKRETSSAQEEEGPTVIKADPERPENKKPDDPASNPQTQSMVIPFNLDETPSKKFSSVSVEIHLADPGPVAVRVLDMSGLEVTPLYTGNLTAGHWIFDWDGQLKSGRRTQPGYYQIEVKSGSYVGRKNILIK